MRNSINSSAGRPSAFFLHNTALRKSGIIKTINSEDCGDSIHSPDSEKFYKNDLSIGELCNRLREKINNDSF